MLGNFGPRWHHIGLMLSAIWGSVSAFVLDLGISVSLNFCPCKAFAKNTTNTKEKTQYLGCVADAFCCYVLVVFVSFFCGMLHLGYACLISGLCLAIVGYVGTIAILVYFVVCVGFCCARVGTILGLSWAILGYVGTFWATLASYFAHVEPFRGILGSVSAFVLDLGISVSLNFRPCNAFAKKHHKYLVSTYLDLIWSIVASRCLYAYFIGR